MKHFNEWAKFVLIDDFILGDGEEMFEDWKAERTEMIAVLEAHVELFTIMYGSSQILPENNKCIKECCERAMAVLEKAKQENWEMCDIHQKDSRERPALNYKE